MLYLVCSLDDEHYTNAEFSIAKTKEEALEIAHSNGVFDSDVEITYSNDDTRIDYCIGDEFVVCQIFEVEDNGFIAISWHAYDGVDFEILNTNDYTLDGAIRANQNEIENLRSYCDVSEDDDNDEYYSCFDTGNEWAMLKILEIKNGMLN